MWYFKLRECSSIFSQACDCHAVMLKFPYSVYDVIVYDVISYDNLWTFNRWNWSTKNRNTCSLKNYVKYRNKVWSKVIIMKVLTSVNFISIIKMNFISYMGGVAEYLRTGRSCVHVHNLTYFDKCMPLNNRTRGPRGPWVAHLRKRSKWRQ